ncbi:MAG: polysaccharide deacetylase family protein [Deltaproteobacteria bacterium]|nr:polysaccharide deacetylase family protein [Deltaproteobacteria bacterium]
MRTLHRLRRVLAWLTALGLRTSGVLAWLRRRRARCGHVLVLVLHRVGGSPRGAPLSMPEAAFRKMLAGLAQRYRICTWEECVAAPGSGDPRLRVVLSFDDGYRDNAEVAWPILRAAGASALFFPTTSFLDGEPLWWELVAAAKRAPGPTGEAFGAAAEAEIARLKGVPASELSRVVGGLAGRVGSDPGLSQPMEWEDVRTMATQGAVFGGHGATHALLTGCSDAELATELETCRRRLTEQLGHEISLFAYPDTAHDARTVSAVRAAGFRYAFIGDGRVYTPDSDPLRIPRISIDGSLYSVAGRFSWTLLEAEILGAFDGLRRRFGWSP